MQGKKWHDLWHFLFLGMCLKRLVSESDDLRVCRHGSWERINNRSGVTETLLVAVTSFCLKLLKPPMNGATIAWEAQLHVSPLPEETPGYFADYGGSFQVSQDPWSWWSHVQPHRAVSPCHFAAGNEVDSSGAKCPMWIHMTCGIQLSIMPYSWGPFVSSKSCVEARTSRESILSCGPVPYRTSHITHPSKHSRSLDPKSLMVRVMSLQLLFVDSEQAEVHVAISTYIHLHISEIHITYIKLYCVHTHTHIYIYIRYIMYIIYTYACHLFIKWVGVAKFQRSVLLDPRLAPIDGHQRLIQSPWLATGAMGVSGRSGRSTQLRWRPWPNVTCKMFKSGNVQIFTIHNLYTCTQTQLHTNIMSHIKRQHLSRATTTFGHRHSFHFEKQESQIRWEAGECCGNSRLVRKGAVEGMWSVSYLLTFFETFWWNVIWWEVVKWYKVTMWSKSCLAKGFCLPKHQGSSDSSTLTQVDVYLPDAPKLDLTKNCRCLWTLYRMCIYIYIYIQYIYTISKEGEMYVIFVLVRFCYFKITEWKTSLAWRWKIDLYPDHWAWNRQGLPFRSLSD